MLLSLALAAAAPEFQSTAILDAIVTQFTGKALGEQGGARAPVDKRLKLQACAAPQLEWRSETKDAVVVRCMAPAWRIFVPVDAVPQPKPAPVAAQAPAVSVKALPVIRRGDPITVAAGAAGFSITREGIAMGDAVAGARLLVKVDEKKAPIQAVAVESGLARLP
ncbi:flagella basal body P-ring formation protein FlgA [Sphingomonas sp. HF-S4]|uniref:Flagella basal body P-ring formation protein FlgA n=1 Tax=Sphingomonas agrestis TaxID=3080540 RepID=A0ABU3YAS4_9SPHN|nr:flagella basal body P-ring formation protein FlgA [Sphingomonas sp. HF-S4]MDV3458494.1 flagella basal body P-ring formation protein FlgA [Sphingomonas sp. HF-S4]